MTAPGPKELQPWIREVNKAIKDLNQGQNRLATKLERPRVTKPFAESFPIANSSEGITDTSDFFIVGASNGPELQLYVPGPVLITVSGHIRATQVGADVDTLAYGSVAVMVDGNLGDSVNTARYWGHETFVLMAGHPDSPQGRTVSVTRPISVGRGLHTFRTVCLYRHITAGIYLTFSHLSIMAEVI